MKLRIQVSIIYPDTPPTEERKWPTRNEQDNYDQKIEIDEADISGRLEAIIKAFNGFK